MNFQIGSEKNNILHHNQKINIREVQSEEDNEDSETQTPFQMQMNIKFNKQLAQSNQGALKQSSNIVRLPSIARLSLNNSPFDEANYNYVLKDQF
jgi:hypothetical protein